mgnify:CR=1 FL=1
MARRLFGLFVVMTTACGGSVAQDVLGAGGDAAATSTSDASGTSSDAGLGADGNLPDTATFCSKLSAWSQKCGAPFDPEACTRNYQCTLGAMRPEAAVVYDTCLLTRDCSTSTDACFAKAAQPYVDDAAFAKFRAACLDKQKQCTATAPIGNEFCDPANALLRPAVLSQFSECLKGECNAASVCLSNAARAAGCP